MSRKNFRERSRSHNTAARKKRQDRDSIDSSGKRQSGKILLQISKLNEKFHALSRPEQQTIKGLKLRKRIVRLELQHLKQSRAYLSKIGKPIGEVDVKIQRFESFLDQLKHKLENQN